ncbi:glycosyl transferase [Nocardioides gansuensis]|uniref:Glycosyl transferase n=1 Tax=Nocardioides gansuensis TaxID=2138300 RepID=A0A2T8FC33_9ACTN|nr:nucleotide disphospho-sugar-binding domain-containing protein [Nocardioides gansuensis]PVG83269.1 glycosyl transferase [Nocardioides gansuensis]
MKVLCYTAPVRGHLFPTVPILLELKRRGHEVVIRTMGAEVPRLREMGLKADAVTAEIDAIQLEDYKGKNPVESLKLGVVSFVRRGALEVPEMRAAIEEEQPDLLLVDVVTWGAAAVAETWGGPWAVVQHAPTPVPSDEVPPFGPGLKPMGGPLGRLRNRLLRPLTLGAVERVVVPKLNELRASVGASPVRDARDTFTRAPLTLYVTSESFDYPRSDWPDSFCFTGPLNWDPPVDPPAWLDPLSRPIALVTTSSEFQDDGELVRVALAALAEEPLDVVATMPAGVEEVELPANAHLEEFVPHSHVLPRAVVAVTHGGFGATQKALSAGVPVVVVPFGRDQAEVGRRVEAVGVGVFLPRKKLSPASLRDAVRRARELEPATRAFAERMKHEGGASLAVDRLEQLLG